MKTLLTAAIALIITALPLTAHAQQTAAGTWRVEQVAQAKPPADVSLTLTFGSESRATVTYTLPGEAPTRWTFKYTIKGNTLTLEPTQAPGEPKPVEYEIRFDANRMLLLPPKPEDDGDPETPEPVDTREPIWILVRD